jgi:hypothetical protein
MQKAFFVAPIALLRRSETGPRLVKLVQLVLLCSGASVFLRPSGGPQSLLLRRN